MNGIDKITKFFVDNASAIFTGLAAVGTVGTVICAVKDTPKALDCLDEAYDEKNVYFDEEGFRFDKEEPLTKMEVIQAAWKCYIPTYVMGALTLASIFAANYAHIQKETALGAMAAFFEQRYSDYRDKVIEVAGEDVNKAIEVDIDKDHMRQDPPPTYLRKYAEADDRFLVYEGRTHQYFTTTKSSLMWAELTANKIFQAQEQVTLNQILALFPEADSSSQIGDKLGWYMDDSYYEFVGYNWGFYGKPWLDFTLEPDVIDGQEVMDLYFSIAPTREEVWDLEELTKTPDGKTISEIVGEITTDSQE